MELEEVGRRVAELAKRDEVMHELHQFFMEIKDKNEQQTLLAARAYLPHMGARLRAHAGQDLAMFRAMRTAAILPDGTLLQLINGMLDTLIEAVEKTYG